MSRVAKNTILKYIPKNIKIEDFVNPLRIYELNNKKIKKGSILYLCEREIRAKDNFALQFAIQKAKALNLPLKVIHPKVSYEHKLKQKFIDLQLEQAENQFKKADIFFSIYSKQELLSFLQKEDIAFLIKDFDPLNKFKNFPFKTYEIDGHNIIPARFISQKQEYSAATLRSKIYHNIYPLLTEYKNVISEKIEADRVLDEFIKNRLQNYAKFKNNPTKNVLSGLSKYLNLGFISSQRVALEVIKSNVNEENKEVFLDELIVRKELADNFCLYANFKTTLNCSNWAKKSLKNHESDIRQYNYDLEIFEGAKTHDKIWNAAQKQLTTEGCIHGYLRMYWAKKISEWTVSSKVALEFARYLNDKYAFDAPSANGYVGILWAIYGLHDRAFTDWFVTGKIRRMTASSISKKYPISEYINKYL